MASDRSIFLRPVEISDPLNAAIPPDPAFHFQFSINNGGAWSDITIPSGVYASVATLCYAIEFQLDAAGLAVTARPYAATAGHYFLIKFAGAGQLGIKFDAGVITETALRNLLGFDRDTYLTGVTTMFAQHNFEHAWYPYRTPSDREGFQKDQAALFAGIRTAQGQLAGIGTGTARYTREFAFPMEPVVNVLEQFCTDEYETAHCAEMFFEKCRTAQINISTRDNPRGFWFVADIEDLHLVAIQQMRGVTDGINFHYSTPDKWTFCVPDPSGPRAFPVAMSRGQAYYNVDFAAHTADAPVFAFSDAIV